ncbi:dynein light chain Tctex-type protein 2B-like [Glandiceps talaboti]
MSERRVSVTTIRRSVPPDPKDVDGSVPETVTEEGDTVLKSRSPAMALNAFRKASRSISLLGFAGKMMSGRDKPNKPKLNLENTYKMVPGDYQRFSASRVERMLNNVLNTHLVGKTYDAKTATTLTINIAEVVKHKTKLMGFERHKIIADVVIGNVADQGAEISSRCLWDAKTDGFASTYFRNGTLFAVATVYAIYFE